MKWKNKKKEERGKHQCEGSSSQSWRSGRCGEAVLLNVKDQCRRERENEARTPDFHLGQASRKGTIHEEGVDLGAVAEAPKWPSDERGEQRRVVALLSTTAARDHDASALDTPLCEPFLTRGATFSGSSSSALQTKQLC